MKIISVVGWHNAGKTTVVEALIGVLKQRGKRVAAIKHTAQIVAMDQEGTDTWRYAQAGGDLVMLASPEGLYLVDRLAPEPSLDDVLLRVPEEVDVVIVEGWKRSHLPKIEVVRARGNEGRIARDGELIAIVSQEREGLTGTIPDGVRVFGLDDTRALVRELEESKYV